MGLNIKKKYYIIPAIYIVIILLLVYMQFGLKKQFTETYLAINLSGATRSSDKDAQRIVQSLDADFNGIKLRFSKSSLLKVEDNSGTTDFKINSYKKNEDSIDLLFDNDFTLNISRPRRGESRYIVTPQLSSAKQIKKIIIPFDTAKNGTMLKSVYFPILGFDNGNSINFITALNKESTFDYTKKQITLLPDSSGKFIITITEAEPGLSEPNAYWLAKNSNISQAASNYISVQQDFIDTAYDVWRINRLDREAGKWIMPDDQRIYSRKVIAALGSEVVRRKAFSSNQWIFRLTESRNSDIRYIETALYNGNIIEAYRQNIEADANLIEEISAKIRRNDADVFLTENLVEIITDRGPYSLIQELFIFAEKVLPTISDLKSAIAIGQTYLNFAIDGVEKDTSIKRLNTIIDQHILSKILMNDSGLYLIVSGDTSEPLLTTKAAKLLIDSIAYTESPIYKEIGIWLINSIISLADKESYVPEYIYTDKSGIKSSQGKIAPEYIYPVLDEAKFLPKFKSLKAQFTPGTWIATCAANITISRPANNRLVTQTRYPVGEIEFMIVQGIPEVTKLSVYGVNWNSASDFERYYTGWSYNQETQTLFIKLQHRQETETIEISF